MKEIDTVCAADMLPVRAHEADAGADLKAARDVAMPFMPSFCPSCGAEVER